MNGKSVQFQLPLGSSRWIRHLVPRERLLRFARSSSLFECRGSHETVVLKSGIDGTLTLRGCLVITAVCLEVQNCASGYWIYKAVLITVSGLQGV